MDKNRYGELLKQQNKKLAELGLENRDDLTRDEFEVLFLLYGKKKSLLDRIISEFKEEEKLYKLAIKSLIELEEKQDFAFKEYARLYSIGSKIVFKFNFVMDKMKEEPTIVSDR